MQIEKKTLRNIFIGLAACIILYWALNQTSSVTYVLSFLGNLFGPFAAGAAIAFILNIPVKGLEKSLFKKIPQKGIRRAVAIICTFLCFVLVVLLILLLIVPQLQITIMSIINEIPSFSDRVQKWVTSFLNENPQIQQWVAERFGATTLDWTGITARISSWVSGTTFAIMNGVFSFAGSLVGGVVNTFIAIVFAVYALFRKDILAKQARMLLYSFLPEKFADRTIYIGGLSNRVFGNFLSGQCLEACILGSLFAITMLIFQMPYVALISVLIAVTALIPVVGAFLGCVIGAFLILVDDPIKAIWFVIMFLILQQIENNLIYPRVVGGSIGLPSMWVLVAVTLGGNVMGVMGMIVMIPAASVVYALLRETAYQRLSTRKIPLEKLYPAPSYKEQNGRLQQLKQKLDKSKTKPPQKQSTTQTTKPK